MSDKPMTDREAMDEAMDALREASNRVESWETDDFRERVKRENDAIIARLQAIADELEWHDPKVKLPEDGQAVIVVYHELAKPIPAVFYSAEETIAASDPNYEIDKDDEQDWWHVIGGVPLSTKHIYRWRAMPVFQRESGE